MIMMTLEHITYKLHGLMDDTDTRFNSNYGMAQSTVYTVFDINCGMYEAKQLCND